MMQDFQPSFERFINTINKEQARDLVRSINLFMKNFRAKEVDSESDSKAVQDFLAYMAFTAFPRHPLWAGSSPEDLETAIEGLEKYLLTKLFDRTFGVDALDRERDTAIGLRLQALQFIRPEHLEIAHEFANDAALLLAQKELAKINMFKSPRDKLACILSCCRVISNLLASKKYGAGADDFTPVLIYVTIKAHPDALASNLAFIERFRMSSRLVSEVSYMFVQMQSAVAFVEMLDVRTSLKVDQDELIAHMLAAGAFTDADLAMLQQPEPRGGSVSALQSQSSEAAAVALVEAAEARSAASKSAGAKQSADLIDFDSGAEPHARPGTSGDAWPSSATGAAFEGHTHGSASGHSPQARNPGHSQADSQSDAWRSQAPQHSRTPSTTFANLLDSEMPNPLLWNDPFQQHQQQQLNQQQRQPPVQLPPHPYLPHSLPPAHSQTYTQSVPQPHFYAPAAPQQPAVWRSGSVGYSPSSHAHPPPPPPPPVPPPPSLPAGPNGTFPYAPAPGFVPPPPPPPPPVPPPPPHLPSSLANPSSIASRTASVPASQGARTMVAAGSLRGSSAAELEEQGVQLLLAADAAGELQERYPLFHASVDALTLADVKRLLDQYKELVIKYECLARAVEEPLRTAHAQAQHPSLPATSTSFCDPATSFNATSTGVPLSLASTAQSTAASAAHPPPPPPPPANNTRQQQQQQQQQRQVSSSLTEAQHSSKASQDAPPQEQHPAEPLHKQEAVHKAHEHHNQKQQQQQQHTGGDETLTQPKGQQPQPSINTPNEGKLSTQAQQSLPAATQHEELSAAPHIQQSQPAVTQLKEQVNSTPEGDQSRPSQHEEEPDLKSVGRQPQSACAGQREEPSTEPNSKKHQAAGAQEAEKPSRQAEDHHSLAAAAQHVNELSPPQPQDGLGQLAAAQQGEEHSREPQEQHQTAGMQGKQDPSRQPEERQPQFSAAQQQVERSPGPPEDEHAQLVAAQQGVRMPGQGDLTQTQAGGTQAQDATQQAPSTVASECSTMQQPPSTFIVDVPEMEQSLRSEAGEDGVWWRRCTLYSNASLAEKSMGEEGGEVGPQSMGEEGVRSMVHGSEDGQLQQGSALGLGVVAASTQREEQEPQQDAALQCSLAASAVAPATLGGVNTTALQQGSEEQGGGEEQQTCCSGSLHQEVTPGSGTLGTKQQQQQQQVKGSQGAEVQGQEGDLLGGDVAPEQQQQQQQQQQVEGGQGAAEVQGQEGDLLGGDVCSAEQPCAFDSTQGSTFVGSSTVDAIIGQGVEHWMLGSGSMTQEGSNDAAGAQARSAELGS